MTDKDINNYLRLAIMEEVNKRMGKNFECVNDLIDYAKNLEKENEQLKQLINKMINCANCQRSYEENDELRCDVINCLNFDKWELAE